MFLLILSYKKPLAEVDRFVAEHKQFLEHHYQTGQFLLSGRKEPRTGGVILLQANEKNEVEEIVRRDPFHREGIADYDIIEFLPSLTTPELSHFKVS
jgi:uncharacterized protein YciI